MTPGPEPRRRRMTRVASSGLLLVRSLLLRQLLGLLAAASECCTAAMTVVFSPPIQCNKTGPCPPHLLRATSSSGTSVHEAPPPPIGSACTVTEVLGCFDLKALGFAATMHDRNNTFDQSESMQQYGRHRPID